MRCFDVNKTKTFSSTCMLKAEICSDASRQPNNIDRSTAAQDNPANGMALREFQDQRFSYGVDG